MVWHACTAVLSQWVFAYLAAPGKLRGGIRSSCSPGRTAPPAAQERAQVQGGKFTPNSWSLRLTSMLRLRSSAAGCAAQPGAQEPGQVHAEPDHRAPRVQEQGLEGRRCSNTRGDRIQLRVGSEQQMRDGGGGGGRAVGGGATVDCSSGGGWQRQRTAAARTRKVAAAQLDTYA